MSTMNGRTAIDIPALLDIGVWLLNAGDPEGALQVYNDVLAAAPRNVDALAGKGIALSALERYDQSTRFLQRACETDPERDSTWVALGVAALASGNGEVALKAFARLQNRGVDPAENYLNLARAAYFALDLERSKDYVDLALAENPTLQAAKDWEAALGALPDQSAFLADVGRTHARRGRFEQGLALLLASLEASESLDGHLYSGRALLALGRAAEAVEHLARAREMNGGNAELQAELGSALALSGDTAQAGRVFDEVLSASPENEEALLGKAELLLESGDTTSARPLIDRLVAISRDNPSVWFLQARTLAHDGRKVSARVAAEHGIVRDTYSPPVWLAAAEVMSAIGQDNLASLCRARARFAETGKTPASAVEQPPALPTVSAEIAELEGIELPDERMAEALRNRVTVYANLGQVRRALEYLEMLLKRYPGSETEELQRHRGSLLRKLGDGPGARKAFERALELDPQSERARLAIERLAMFGI